MATSSGLGKVHINGRESGYFQSKGPQVWQSSGDGEIPRSELSST